MNNKLLYFFLGGGALIMIWLVIVFTSKPQTTDILPTPTPSTTISDSPKRFVPTVAPEVALPENILSPLLPQLPYETDAFLVEYLPKSALIYVTIKDTEAKPDNIDLAVSWLKEQGFGDPKNNARIRFVYFR